MTTTIIIVVVIFVWLYADRILDWWFAKWYGKKDEPVYDCDICNDTGLEEIMGDGDNFEWDVIGHKKCKCQKEFED